MAEKNGSPPARETKAVDVSEQRWGSDFVADLVKGYGFEYVTYNPGASFRGIEESLINYNNNVPQTIETPHEGVSVSIAHGYAKATGEPSLCILHNVVGTLNAAMSIYNAYIDRVPIVMLSGTGPLRKSHRRPWIDWIHSANIQGNLVRDYVKWDDQPLHSDGVAESFLRAAEISQTKPMGPTYITIDHSLQENELEEPLELPDFSKFDPPSRMAPDSRAIEEAAAHLTDAEMPLILVDTVGDTQEAVDGLVDLAETLAAPVMDIAWRRFNFPTTHPLYFSGSDIYEKADVVLGLDVWDIDRVTPDSSEKLTDAIDREFTYIEIGTHELEASGVFPNTYPARETDISILADTTLANPKLAEAVRKELEDDTRAQERVANRYDLLTEENEALRTAFQEEAEEVWDDSPISTARLAGETWNVIQDDDWVLVNNMFPRWAEKLWEFTEFDQYIGGYGGGAGVGYGIGASIGAALAYKGTGRIPVSLQPDGDLMQYVNALWVLGHYDIPLMAVMHNNRQMYNSTNHRMNLAESRGRDSTHESALIGTGYRDPSPDFASIAEAMGVVGYGPVKDPAELNKVLTAAWEDAKNGSPVLVDVVCQSE
ncbi:thiamine pyrophosphate-dependent enzyme [Saliphagus sp. GCM10025334]